MRTFVAIDIPKNVKEEIVNIQNQLPEFKGKKTEFENLHLTLKFLGEVDEKRIEKIRKKLSEINFPRFKTEINSIGFFDSRKSIYTKQIVVWLHMTNCEQLQKQVDEKLSNLFDKEKRFMAHLTIARIKELKNEKKFFEELKEINMPAMNFLVDSFSLKKSKVTRNGSVYSDIETYTLN